MADDMTAMPWLSGQSGEPPAAALDDSPPGASLASSFTFAVSQGSGPGWQGSAASGRHSDWEYVNGQPKSGTVAAKLRDPAEVTPVSAYLTSETPRQLSDRQR